MKQNITSESYIKSFLWVLLLLFTFPAINFVSLFTPSVVSFQYLFVTLLIWCVYLTLLFHLFKLNVLSNKYTLSHTPTSIKFTYDYFLVESVSLELHKMLVISHTTISNDLFYRIKLRVTNIIIKTESNWFKNWIKQILFSDTEINTSPSSLDTWFPKWSKYWPKGRIEKQLFMGHRL